MGWGEEEDYQRDTVVEESVILLSDKLGLIFVGVIWVIWGLLILCFSQEYRDVFLDTCCTVWVAVCLSCQFAAAVPVRDEQAASQLLLFWVLMEGMLSAPFCSRSTVALGFSLPCLCRCRNAYHLLFFFFFFCYLLFIYFQTINCT